MTTKAEDVHEDVVEEEPEEKAAETPSTAEDPDEAPEKEVPPEESGTVRVRVPLGRILVVATAVLVLVASVTTAVVQWREAGRLADDARTEQLVRTRSAEFGQALLAYRHTDLDEARKRIRSLTSSDFGQSYETAFDGLADVIRKYEADAKATVRDIYVNEIDGQRAKSLVVLDTEVHSTAGVRRVLGTKLLLELVMEKGSWKIDSLVTLAADDESLTDPDGTPAKPSTEDPGEKP